MSALRKPEQLSVAEAETPRQILSAMLDDEASTAETEVSLAWLKRDADARQAWSDYHLIGDLMRGVAPASVGFMARFSARLADEPTVLAPRPTRWPQRIAVASFASLAVWGVVTLSGLVTEPATPPKLATAPGTQRAVVSEPVNEVHLLPYLVAHQEFAPMAVASPYQRTVMVESR